MNLVSDVSHKFEENLQSNLQKSVNHDESLALKEEPMSGTKNDVFHPDYSKQEIDYMAFRYESFLKGHTKNIMRYYPLLSDRIDLQEPDKTEFNRLLAEKSLADWLRPGNLSKEDKAIFEERKAQISEEFTQKVVDFLGPQADIFLNYMDKKKQYITISRFKKQFEAVGEFGVEVQDELATLMKDSKEIQESMFESGDAKVLKKSKQQTEELLIVMAERHKQLLEDAAFLSESQKAIFEKQLNMTYSNYKNAASYYQSKRKAKGKKDKNVD